MGRSRYVRPDTVRIDISDGDWLIVKRRLNHGEQRRLYERSRGANDPNGNPTIDGVQAGIATVLAYLVDWSLAETDAALTIKFQSEEDIARALDAIDHDSYVEILRAIEQHDEAMHAERAALKNGPGGEQALPAISPSPVDVAGAMSGSPN